MSSYDPARYGDTCADFYDQLYPTVDAGIVEKLLRLSRGGRVLELGTATGRVARPLSLVGASVFGIDASRKMIAELQSLPGGEGVRQVQGDFAKLPFGPGSFELIFTLKNSLSLLPSVELLQDCLAGIANCLSSGGHFVYESFPNGDVSGSGTFEYTIATDAGRRKYFVPSLEVPTEKFIEIGAAAGLSLADIRARWNRVADSTEEGRVIMLFYRRQGS